MNILGEKARSRLGRLQFFRMARGRGHWHDRRCFYRRRFGTAEKGPNPLHWLLVLAILGWLIFYIGILAPRRLRDMGRIRLGR